MNKTDDELRADIYRNESRADWSGRVLLFGLAVEFILILVGLHGEKLLDRAPEAIATALVTLGVWGELHFGRKESEARAELQSRSDVLIAQLNKKAAEAERETERLKGEFAWLTLSPEAIEKLADAIALEPAPFAINIEVMANDPESQRYALNFVVPFRKAGRPVRVLFCTYSDVVFKIHAPSRNPQSGDVNSQPFQSALRGALSSAGIGFEDGPIPGPSMTTGRVWGDVGSLPVARMYIGPKSPPDDQPWLA